jgi:hypothetical protein
MLNVTHKGFQHSDGKFLSLGDSDDPLDLTGNTITKGSVTIRIASSTQLTLSGDGVTSSSVPLFPNDNLLRDSSITVTGQNQLSGLKPSPPSIVSVTAMQSGTETTVVFSAPAFDGGLPIILYTISAYLVSEGIVSTSAHRETTSSSLSKVVNGLTPGSIYVFKVTARNSVGDSPPSDASSEVTQYPGQPTGVLATSLPSGLGATVSFTAPTVNGSVPITRYVVKAFRGDAFVTESTLPMPTNSLTKIVSGLSKGVTYYFKVLAHNSAGDSELSDASANLTLFDVPSEPTQLNATSLTTGLGATVRFSPPLNNGGTTITEYVVRVYLSTNLSSVVNEYVLDMTAIPTPTAPFSVLMTGLSPALTYQYKVFAHNSVGDGPASTLELTQDAVVPEQPTSVSGVSRTDGTSATVTFTAPSFNGGATITSYVINAYLSTDLTTVAASATLDMTVTPTPALSKVVTGLTPGATYKFKVLAHNRVGDGPLSNPSDPVMISTVPDQPTSVSATSRSDGTSATVAFLAPSFNGGVTITSYVINAYLSTDLTTVAASATLDMTVTPTPALSKVVTGLTSGATYKFKVLAHNSVGDGHLSEPSDPVTIATIPGQPTSVSGVSRSDGISATVTFSAPSSNGGATITSYVINAYLSTDLTTVAASATLDMTVTPTPALSKVVTGLTSGATYKFKVLAHNSVGDGHLSEPSAAVTTPTAPSDPTLLTATQTTLTSSTVTFSAPSSNGGATITSYVINAYLSNNLSTVAASATLDMTVTPTPALSAVVTGLSGGSSYTFKVFARNSVDLGSPSNTLTLSMSNVPTAPTSVAATSSTEGYSAAVTFSASSSNGGRSITAYILRAYFTGTNEQVGTTVTLDMTASPAPTLSGTLTDLIPGRPFVIRVIARNNLGDSAAGEYSLTMNGGDESMVYVSSSGPNKLTIYWSKPNDSYAWLYKVILTGFFGVNGGPVNWQSTMLEMYAPTYATFQLPFNQIDSVGVYYGSDPNPPYHYRYTDNFLKWKIDPYAPFQGIYPGYSSPYIKIGKFIPLPYYPYFIVAPYTPLAVSASASGGSVTVSWTSAGPSGSATSYTIQRSTDNSTFTDVGSSSTTTYVDSGLSALTTYYYRVVATNGLGSSVPSSSVSATTGTTVPGEPTGITITQQAGSVVTLTFTTPANNGGVSILDYKLYAYLVTNGVVSSTYIENDVNPVTTTGTSGDITRLTEGNTYVFKVGARNENGIGSLASTAQYTMKLTASAPRNLTVVAAGPTSATVSWTAPLSDGGSTVTYQVSEYSYSRVRGLLYEGAGTSFTADNLTSGTVYTYYVFPKNAGGVSDNHVFLEYTHPSIPSKPTISVSSTGPALTMTATSTGDGGSTITSYVFTLTPNNPSFATKTYTSTTNSYTVNGSDLGEVFWNARCQAVNVIGSSDPSELSSDIGVGIDYDSGQWYVNIF